MSKKIDCKKIFIQCLLFVPIILSGCSLTPQKMDADKVEKIAKEAINSGVYLSEKEPEIEELYDGKHYIYIFRDERDIPFTVEMTSPYYSLIDFRKGSYEDYVVFHTDYREAIMSYYYDQVKDILESVDGINFDKKDKEIIRISDEEALESLEDVLMEMDELYDFEYAYSDELRLELNKNAYWEDFRQFDLLIRYDGKQEEIFFTVNSENVLSIDDVHEIINDLEND